MPIGAIIGGVASIGGSLLASKSNSKAIKSSQQAQQQSDAAQIALQRDIYGQNQAALSPYMQRGNVAGDTINALMGLGGAPQAQGTPQGALTAPNINGAYSGGYMNPSGNPNIGEVAGLHPWIARTQGLQTQNMPLQQVPAGQAGAPGQSPQQAALAAYEIFKQSTGYQTRLTEGNRSLASNYFGGGVGQSGAAVKAALRYGQDYASNEFGNYLGYLGNQQGVGFAGASALAGVGQGYADRMGQISQNGADNASAAAIARAQNSNAMWSGIAGGIGSIAGSLSSYRKPGTPALGYY